MTRAWPAALVPFALLGLLAAAFLVLRPLDWLTARRAADRDARPSSGWRSAPRASRLRCAPAARPRSAIAQVQVDGAYWQFEQSPPGPLGRLAAARIDIPYPWVEGETHHLRVPHLVGRRLRAHDRGRAADPGAVGAPISPPMALVGLFVGVVPVALGMLFYPALRGLGRRGLEFVLALTVGLLVFLLIDTLEEGLEIAAEAAAGFHGEPLVWLGALLTLLALLVVGRRGGRRAGGLALAGFIALGIGLHNLGEGLAIGASFAAGEAALASFLVLGFALHNVTEGSASRRR